MAGTSRRKTKRLLVTIASGLVVGAIGFVAMMKVNGGINNSPFSIYLVYFAIVFIVVVPSIFAFADHRKRERSVKETKAGQISSLGLTQLGDAKAEIKERFGALPELRHKGSIKKVFKGELAGRELFVFSHLYTVHTGQATVPVNTTIYAVRTPDWPATHIVPTNRLGHWLRTLLGRRYLTLDLPEFNRRFHVITTDESFAITLLHPDLQRHILDKRTVKWRLIDGWLCLNYRGPMKLDRAPTSLRRLERFLELIPPELDSWVKDVSVDA